MKIESVLDTKALEELIEKQKLYENMMTYCRGQDRKDVELMKSTYWPDATDDHGAFIGNGHEFCEWAYRSQKESGHSAIHHCGNTLTELMGDRAKRETVFMYVQVQHKQKRTLVLSGRYRDLCEKRDGEWRVLRRVCIWDWGQELPENADYLKVFGIKPDSNFGATYPNDPIHAEW